jgi:peptide/nickel transport system substrate-binding protein
VITLVVIALAVCASACGGGGTSSMAGGTGAQSGDAASQRTLTFGTPRAPTTLHPLLDRGSAAPMMPTAYETIIKQHADGKLVPGLATSWRYVKTKAGPNQAFEFALRENARFSNGEPVTAEAVETWLNYAQKTLGESLGLDLRSVKIVGKWTIRLTLGTPHPDVALALASYAMGRVAAPEAVAHPKKFVSQTYGAGPYVLDAKETVSKDHYTFLPNPYYYDKSQIKWSKIVFKVIPTPSTMLQALKAGQIDLADGSPTTADAAAAAGFDVHHASFLTNSFQIFDRGGKLVKALADVRVRQALNYAVDRKTACRATMGKYSSPTSMQITPEGVDPKYQNYYSYDPKKAKELLAEAGYPDGFDLPTVGTFDAQTVPQELVGAVAKYFGDVGVRLKITDANTVKNVVDGKRTGYFGAYQIFAAWDYVLANYLPDSFLNPLHVSDPVVNRLYEAALRSAEAPDIWKQLFAHVTEQADYVFLCTVPQFIYSTKEVGGVTMTSQRTVFLPVETFPQN